MTNNYKGHFPSQIKRAVRKVKAHSVNDTVVQRETRYTPQEDHNIELVDAVMEDDISKFSSDDIKNIKLPSTTWKSGCLDNGRLNFFQIEETEKSVVIQKLLSVDFNKRTLSQTILNRELTDVSETTNSFTSLAQIEELLMDLHNAKICPGIIHDPEKHLNTENLVRNVKLFLGIWRSDKCSHIISETGKMKPCRFCKLLNNALRIQFKRHKNIKLHTKINHKYLSMKQLSRKVVAKAKREAQLKFTLKTKNDEIMKLKGELKDMRLKSMRYLPHTTYGSTTISITTRRKCRKERSILKTFY